REARRVVAQEQELSAVRAEGHEAVELRGNAAGERERELCLEIVAEEIALFAARGDQRVVEAREAVERDTVARGQSFGEAVGGKPHERTAAAELLDLRGRRRVRVLFRTRAARRDARLAARAGGEHDARVKVAVWLRQKIRDLGVAVFLEDRRRAAVGRE